MAGDGDPRGLGKSGLITDSYRTGFKDAWYRGNPNRVTTSRGLTALPGQDSANADRRIIFTRAAPFFAIVFADVNRTAGEQRHLETVITDNQFRADPGCGQQEQKQEK